MGQKGRREPSFSFGDRLWRGCGRSFVAYLHTMQILLNLGHPMRLLGLGILCLCCAGTSALAQQAIYRCGNEYTNVVSDPAARGCKLIQGANVTVVPGTRVQPPAAKTGDEAAAPVAPVPRQRVASSDQKARDADARQILLAELKKAESRQAELLREYNNGEPERRSDETRNYQKYLDRVAELKASLARNESDIASIRRELARQPAASAPAPAR